MRVGRRVELATRRWIESFVIRERLCPFAAPSKILVHVETFGIDGKLPSWELEPLRDRSHAEMAMAAVGRAEQEV